MDKDPGLMGLHYFLSAPRDTSVPSTLKPQLLGISEALDPALAEPASKIQLSTRDLFFGKDMRLAQLLGLNRSEDFENAERETPELLIQVTTSAVFVEPSSPVAGTAIEWYGRANLLSDSHVHNFDLA